MQYLCMLIDASDIVVCLYSKSIHKHFKRKQKIEGEI